MKRFREEQHALERGEPLDTDQESFFGFSTELPKEIKNEMSDGWEMPSSPSKPPPGLAPPPGLLVPPGGFPKDSNNNREQSQHFNSDKETAHTQTSLPSFSEGIWGSPPESSRMFFLFLIFLCLSFSCLSCHPPSCLYPCFILSNNTPSLTQHTENMSAMSQQAPTTISKDLWDIAGLRVPPPPQFLPILFVRSVYLSFFSMYLSLLLILLDYIYRICIVIPKQEEGKRKLPWKIPHRQRWRHLHYQT